MDGPDALRMLRRFIAAERTMLMESYNKGQDRDDYMKTVGRVKSLDAVSAKLDELLKMKGDAE